MHRRNKIRRSGILVILATIGVLATSSPAVSQTPHSAQRSDQVNRPVMLKREPFDPNRDAKSDLAAAITKATAAKKRIILDIGGEWCGWCRYMDEFFAAQPELTRARDKNYIWLKINYSEENENREFLAAYPNIPGYPHLFVLDPDGKLVHSQDTSEFERGPKYSASAILEFLNKWAPEQKSSR